MEKRKSFKCGRRRSRSLGGILNAKEICKTIQKSLPSSQKLQLLLQYALEYGLSLAERDLCEDIDYAEFRKNSSKCQVAIESEIEEMNYCSLAVANDEITNTNIPLNEKREYESAIITLEEENKHWDQILAKYRKNLDNEVNLVSMQYDGPFDIKKYQHLNYSDIVEDVQNNKGHLDYQIEKLIKTEKHLKANLKLTSKAILSLNEEAGKNFVKTFEETPRSLIKKCF
ncbi:uncharacterized protein TNIN_357791 [Trichonephila inaurata madagascariensis]|uniref:Uncharacterized protein n=1 Tax=Trichonephila inaurata madagascariensis TaxID=2747483 RepID=A0A8X6ITV2_9ARAC|nr:uncharacterized protein TNIN_357791 [Trichonephila inaurata madagascariensis]